MNIAPLIEYFAGVRGQMIPPAALSDRRFLAALLTAREPGPIPAEVNAQLDTLLSKEAEARGSVEADKLPTLAARGAASGAVAQRMRLWRGDLTVLRADAIVNAANDRMLGCFVPGHHCIDNAIHAAAGPGLREECAEHIRRQGHPEPTGTATLTAGYHLPASFVIHTVGPIVPSHQPTADDEAALASCYRSILDAASAHGGISTVGFCAISTGVFGYPKDAGARVAIGTIRDWLTDHPDSSIEPLVSAFTPADEAVYLDAIREVLA